MLQAMSDTGGDGQSTALPPSSTASSFKRKSVASEAAHDLQLILMEEGASNCAEQQQTKANCTIRTAESVAVETDV